MDKLHTKAFTEIVDGKMLAVASEEVKDREGEILSIDGWDLKNFKKNPVLLYYHNMRPERSLPIGKAKSIKFLEVNGKKRLVFEPEFEEITEFGRTVKRFYEEGYLNSFSVGFIPLEKDGNRYIRQELLEVSAVPVPALPTAQIIERTEKHGFNETCVKALLGDEKAVDTIMNDGKKEIDGGDLNKNKAEVKNVVPFHAFDKAEDSRMWDAGAAISRLKKKYSNDKNEIDFKNYKNGFTWYDESKAEDIEAYKLPHHDVQGETVVTVWRGVASAMANLMGAKGELGIKEDERQKVYEHLKKHYEEFGKAVPDYRLVEQQVLKGLEEEIVALNEDYQAEKTYRVLSKIRAEVKKQKVVSEVKKPVKIDSKDLIKLLGMVFINVKNLSNNKGVKYNG